MKNSGLLILLFFALTIVNGQSIEKLKSWEFLRSDLGGVWEGIRYAKKGSQEAVPKWQNVEVPHCYNAFDAVNPYVNYYQGPGWYRTFLNLDVPLSEKVLLHFEGTGQKAEVYVFNEKVGSHVGGYDEWWVDITDALKKYADNEYLQEHYNGKIPLLVRCDNSRDLEMIPSDLSDFNIYGGMYRPVNLVRVPLTYIQDIKLSPLLNSKFEKGSLNIEVAIANQDKSEYSLKLELLSPQGKIVQTKDIKQVNESSIFSWEVSKPELWSPASPLLYTVNATIKSEWGEQVISEKIGFRDFEFVKNGPFMLNGQRLLIRGTHRHEDHAGTAAAISDDDLTKEMILMKDMGVNFIRLAHYQQSAKVLQLCDSLGILVWEEIPWCRGGLGGEIYKQQARRMLENMITQHYNHPSVIIWGLGNENDWPGDFTYFDQDSIRAFMTELNTIAHKMDDSRKTGIRRCDFCKDIVDVYSPSIWAGWYRGKFTEYKATSEKWIEDVDHFFHMEWGASHHTLRHSEDPEKGLEGIATGKGTDERAAEATFFGGDARVSKDGDWTVTYACNLIDWHLKEQETMPNLTGAAYWPFKDFSTPVRPENPIPYMNQKGVVERDLTPKESYYVFQSYWTEKPMAHIYGSTWPVRWGKEGEAKLVKVYSNCDKAELFLNERSLGIKKRDSQNYPAAGLHWNVVFEPGKNQLKVVAQKGKTTVNNSIAVDYETRQWGKPKELDYTLKVVEPGITEVEVVLKDSNGVICLDNKSWVEFEYVGDGKMLADLGTLKGSRKVQMANGRAFMRIAHHDGKGVLRVITEELTPQLIWINNK